MNSVYTRIGFGAYSGTGTTIYWTQDFGSCDTIAYTTPLYSGSHIFYNSQTRFIANYMSTGGAPLLADVVISGVPYAMSLDLGLSAAGNYIYADTTYSACREYYFHFQDASGKDWFDY